MWYGSSVLRHGRSRPCRRYQASSRVAEALAIGRRREAGSGLAVASCGGSALRASRIIPTSVKIYTRTGDAGETSLFDGTRVSKADARVDAYGEVDELNAWLGCVARRTARRRSRRRRSSRIQRDLFALGAQLADPAATGSPTASTKAALGDDDVARLEALIDRLEAELPPLRRFILAGGSPAGAALHLARTVCRRAERRMVALQPPVDAVLIRYVNRLSDLLFVMARAVNHRAGAPETEW